jgi:hypothetical protein
MNYPDDFDTPSFPAGRRIAISRMMAVATLCVFLIIIFLCGILFWSSRSENVRPFMIGIRNDGTWAVVGHDGGTPEYSINYTMQESLAGNFVKSWFTISESHDANLAAWKQCDRTTCVSGDELMFGSRECSIYCNTGDDLFSDFYYNILPDWEKRESNGTTWSVRDDDMRITPAGVINENGGTWRISATILDNNGKTFNVMAFLKIAKNNNYHPATLGFYVADFNAYRLD